MCNNQPAKKKRVLIISELFYPMNVIGAVRPTKLAKLLAANGYQVDVFTTPRTVSIKQELERENYNLVSGIEDMEASEEEQGTSVITKIAGRIKKRGKILSELAMTRRQLLYIKAGKAFCRSFVEAVNTGRVDLTQYDCVFSTFGPVGSLLVGRKAKKLCPQLRWICDFRDPMLSQAMPKSLAWYYGYLQKKSIRLADSVTTVSNGYRKRIMPAKYLEKCTVIPNGYDPEDQKHFEQVLTNGRFSFAYVGALYEGKRDLGCLFKAIRWAVDEGMVSTDHLQFHYAGREGACLRQQAASYDLESIITDHGQIGHDECLRLQASVRFLVMSTWNDKGEEGVFPGKLIEYMLMKKPVINIVGGKLPNCEVTGVIRALELGISCEEADQQTYEQLKQWLAAQCGAYQTGWDAIFTPKTENIDARYNWENIVKRFGELIEG